MTSKTATSPHVPRHYTSRALGEVRRVIRNTGLAAAVHLGAKVTLHGADNVAGMEAPFVVAANHSSHMDTALIYAALPEHLTEMLGVGAAADYWFMSKLKALVPILLFNGYPVDRPGRPHRGNHRGLSAALLRAGVPLLIFPEGSRSRTGAMAPFTPGVARLCTHQQIPCIPVAIVGASQAWPASSRLPRWPRREVHVAVGRPLTPRPGEGVAAFAHRMERAVVDLHDATAARYGMKSLAVLAARRSRRRS